MQKNTIISYLGKGGTGKTILSALTGKIAISMGLKILFIDADPAMGLATSLEILENHKTIGTAREEIIRQSRIATKEQEKQKVAEIVDYLMLEALYESEQFCMLMMGQTDTLGCYCPLNSLLRSTIENMGTSFDLIIIDAEAGIEQINRQVVENVHYPVIVSDNSLRGVRTCIMARDTINKVPKMHPVKVGVAFNRVDTPDDNLVQKIKDEELLFYGHIPPDPIISEFDRKGNSIIGLPEDSIAVSAMKKLLDSIGVFS